MYCFYKLLFITVSLSFSTLTHAEVYKWVDQSGRMHFSDQAPLNITSENIEITELVTYTSAKVVENDVDINETLSEDKTKPKKSRRKKVVMYSAAWCGVCTKAKKYFKKNKIPFKEYDIDKSKKAKSDFKKLKARGIPVILVGKKRLNGFNVKKFESIYRS
ncbi:MAG: glutaredoxin family protein [Gammaproteobacteria bacterium]|nr:glutaredoxin family protein [Gammaproteobacteria bacterium]